MKNVRIKNPLLYGFLQSILLIAQPVFAEQIDAQPFEGYSDKMEGDATPKLISGNDFITDLTDEEIIAYTAQANNQFSFDILKKFSSKEPGNIFFSSYSIETALGMTMAGADGNTKAEMLSALRLDTLEDYEAHYGFSLLQNHLNNIDDVSGDIIQLSTANGIWKSVHYTFEQDFLNLTAENYEAQLVDANFDAAEEVRKEINGWVEEKTEECIQELLPEGSIDSSTVMVLVNAIYMKAPWLKPFDPELTKEETFYLTDGTEKTIQTMHGQFEAQYAKLADAQLLSLPLTGLSHESSETEADLLKPLDVLLLLPDDVERLIAFEESLNAEAIDAWVNEMTDYEVDVSLPRFTVEFEKTINDDLQALGMIDAFNYNADFSKMLARNGINIDIVRHKAFLEVREEGVEAAAATAVTMERTSVPSLSAKMILNRPFYLFIRERETGTILFTGFIADPQPIKNDSSDLTKEIATYFDMDKVNLSDDNMVNTWLGSLYVEQWPWAYNEDFGWFYCSGTNAAESGWFYSTTKGWIWTSEKSYINGSWYFSLSDQEWISK